MEKNCSYCKSPLHVRGFYCPSCKKQIKCKSCGEELEQNVSLCIMCGEDVLERNSNTSFNNVEFSETRAGRTFKASFSDTVASSMSEAFGLFLINKVGNNTKKIINNEEEDVQDVDFIEDDSLKQIKKDNGPFDEIFEMIDGKVSLKEPRLKAVSKQDFGKRLICLVLYYKKLLGLSKMPRIEITRILKETSIEDGNMRHMIRNESTLFRKSNEDLEILLPGIEFAKKIIEEISDSSVVEVWKLGTKGKSTSKAK